MPALTTDLPGSLSERTVLVQTFTYIAAAQAEYRYIASSSRERADIARGVQIVRSTEQGWAHEPGAVVTEVRLLTGSTHNPAQFRPQVLLSSPAEVQRFLEQYAPEVLQQAEEYLHPESDAEDDER